MNATTPPSGFGATRWTLVMRATGASAEARAALSELCEFYYEPVFRFLRKDGRDEDAARELAQEFFAQLLQRGQIGQPDRAMGRFRSYLLGALKHFLSDRRDFAQRHKRGGGVAPESLDAPVPGSDTRSLQVADPASTLQDTYFDRQWAIAVMARALRTLENEFVQSGKQSVFAVLKTYLEGEPNNSQAEVAAKLNIGEGALKVAIHRLRKRFREIIRAELAQTVEPEEVDSELRYLAEVLSRQ